MEAGGLWLVDLVPGVLSDLIDIDSFVWVCVENFGDHIFRIL